MSVKRSSVLVCLLVCLVPGFDSSAVSITDQVKWPPGAVPPGETNGPDGLDDIWQGKFNAWAVDPEGDNDGDGRKNNVEAVAGTDPFVGDDRFEIEDMEIAGVDVLLSSKVEAGKKYRVLSSDKPGGAPWTAENLQTPVSGTQEYIPSADQEGVSFSVAKAAGSRKFYQLETSDVDSNSDGVSDWVARQLGLNPASLDSNDDGVSDADQITEELTTQDVVTVTSENAFTTEDGGQPGMLKVRRNHSLLGMTTQYTLSGTASQGVDFAPLDSPLAFAPGTKEIAMPIIPVDDSPLPESGESVTVTLDSAMAENYAPLEIGSPDNATVIILDPTAATGTGLLGRFYNTGSNVYMHGGNFGQAGTYAYTRTSTGVPNTGNIVIPYTASPAVQVGHVVRATFTGGNLNNALYNHQDYTVTAVNAGVNFTLGITGASLPTNSNSNCQFSIQSFPHPAVIERVDATLDYDWGRGTPNGNTISPANLPDNYSSAWEGYLHPTTAGDYTFQLDADDKARVLLDTGGGLVQILEHGWDGPATVGTFKQSAPITLAVPGSPAARYKIRVEHVETTGDARCRLQWRLGTAAFANIPQANVYSHTSAMNANYSYTRLITTPGAMSGTIVVTLNGHPFILGNNVNLAFSSGNLFTPANGNFHGIYTISATTANTFTVPIAAPTLPSTGTGAGFVLDQSNSATTGWFNRIYSNTAFTAPPGRVGIDNAGATNSDNGIYRTGSPDAALMDANSFTIRWTGQVQPQFTEEYTFVLGIDEGCRMWIDGEEQIFRSATATNVGGSTYTYDGVTGETVINYAGSALEANNFAPGDIVRLDPSSGSLTSLATLNYVVTAATSTTFTVNFGTGVFASGSGSINIDSLNRPFKLWGATTSTTQERFVRIPMVGGVRYDIRLDYYENSAYARCRLFWYSPSQPRQLVPANRLYPESEPQAPPFMTSPTEAVAIVGGPFSYPVGISNGAAVSVSGLPDWLSLVGGALTGTPPPGSAGTYQIVVTGTGGTGAGTSLITLEVVETDGEVEREYWFGVGGTSVADVPVGSPPSGVELLTSLEAATEFGNNYGARIRGYITAPETGNYYFWIASSNASELWISNDDEPVNAFKRASVITGNPVPQTWTGDAGMQQKSPWMALEQGQRYYFEILHKAGVAAGDNLAVGWSKPGESTTAPSEVVPGYVLDTYVPPAPGSTPGTLYFATMLSQGGADTNGVGTSTLRLSEDETVAYVKFDDIGFLNSPYNGLSGVMTDWHVHSDPFLSHSSFIIYDGAEPLPGDGPQPDGSHKWNIAPAGTLSADDIRELIKQGKAYINLHTAAYPAGEIRGNYTLANGSRTFSPPPAPPAWTDDSGTAAGASRFLTQATFGPSITDITALTSMADPAGSTTRYEAWIEDQFTKPASELLPEVFRTELTSAQGGAFDERLAFNAWWWRSIAGDDQLRQRIAFALHEIHVVSGQGPLDNRAQALAYFYDKLAANAFGNFRDILEDTSLTYAMGRYLDMWRNPKPNQSLGLIPNENYAREIKQLFSIGLFRMWPDGSLILTSEDEPVDTYTQREIIGFSHAFTGWDYGYTGAYRTSFNAPVNYTDQMREVPAQHFTGQKRILNNEVLPGLTGVGSQPLDPFALHNTMQYSDPEYQALAAQELDATHDQLFNHPNTGPFICRQLIQRLVTSHPSRDYLYRVVQKFNDNGSGVRGDMQAVIKAIFLDYEARTSNVLDDPAYGKQREPLMRVAAMGRAFRQNTFSGTYSQSGTRTITINTVPAGTPHNLTASSNVFLDFTSAGVGEMAPWIGSYSSPAVVDADTFTVNANGWVTGSYTIPSNSTVCTVNMNNHWIQAGHQFYIDFTSGTANGQAIDQKVYTVATATAEVSNPGSFTFAVTSQAGARSGSVMIPRFSPGSYTVTNLSAADQAANPPFTQRITLDTLFDHHLQIGDQVQLNFYAGNPQPADMVGIVKEVVDLNTYAVFATGVGVESFNSVYQFPLLSQPLTRSGDVGSRPSTFIMNNTDADLDQTPIYAETVFNYFLPDFKLPGALASQGITTPEFMTTAETTVVRQANFLYNGIFNPSATTSLHSSFRWVSTTNNNAIVMGFLPWMPSSDDATNIWNGGAAPYNVAPYAPSSTTVPWTHNQNIVRLIDQMSILLTANQLSAEAKTIIRNFVSLPIASIPASNPCEVNTGAPHGYTTGDLVCISGVSTNGNFQISGVNGDYFSNTTTTYAITVVDADTFTVNGVSCLTAPGASSNDHVSPVIYNQGDSTPDKNLQRDRIRAIVHLITTSPDFTIQK